MKTKLLAFIVVGLFATLTGRGADKTPTIRNEPSTPYVVRSGVHTNTTETNVVVFREVIMLSGGNLLRLHFDGVDLGQHSFVRITSLADRGVQKLDGRAMIDWQYRSAIFNGDTLLLELCVAPGEQGVFANVDQVLLTENLLAAMPSDKSLPKTLCGADSRVASTDNRVGRINGCTAWLISNGAVLTAGHCAPSGTIGGVFEVNVPASSSSGGAVASDPNDQYPIDNSNLTFVNGGGGNDWTVFGLLPNSNTGQRAHLQHGFFRITRETPSIGTTLRVTGFGVDNSPSGTSSACCATDSSGNCTHTRCNAQNRTLQTATGGFVSEVGSASQVELNYSVDTEPANSGSPVIWNGNGFAIGIHTNGGCNSDGSGSNSGTSFENNGLENAIAAFPGANARYVDTVTYPNSPSDNGTVFQPFHDLSAAASSVPSGGLISLVQGNYPKSTAGNLGSFGTGNKAMLLTAPVGAVTIGQ
jgi:V8-like Glu-specific endopeptidase